MTEVVYVPATGAHSIAANAAFIEALNTLAEDWGQDVRFQIVPPRPTAAGLIGARTPPQGTSSP